MCPHRNDDSNYYSLDDQYVDPKRLKKEREKARKLKKSQGWQNLLNRGICHYCEKKFPPSQLTMDHIVPLARGGESTPGNIAPACSECNRDKQLHTPVDQILQKLRDERSED